MGKWALLKPLLPWLGWWLAGAAVAVFGIGFGAGFKVADWRDQGTIERARKDCALDKQAAAQAAIDFLRQENDRLDHLARRQASRAEALRLMLRDLSAQAEQEREELKHALAQTDLRSCDARKPARVLGAKAERYRRQLARAQAHGHDADGAGHARAGEARQGP